MVVSLGNLPIPREQLITHHEVSALLLRALELVVDVVERDALHLWTVHQIRVLEQEVVLRQEILGQQYGCSANA
jgi:hypothetical protein